MISTGGRGRNAPELTARDLSVIILALLSTGQANQGAARARYFSEFGLRYYDYNRIANYAVGIDEGFEDVFAQSTFVKHLSLSNSSRFIDAVEAVLVYYSKQDFNERTGEIIDYISKKYGVNSIEAVFDLMREEEERGEIERIEYPVSFEISVSEGPMEYCDINAVCGYDKEYNKDILEDISFFDEGRVVNPTEKKKGMTIRRLIGDTALYEISRMLRE